MATFMADRTTSDDETSPLLGHQTTGSCQTLVGSEITQKVDCKEVSGRTLVWILVAVWSAVFLGALDGTPSRSLILSGHTYIHATTGTIVATLLSPIGSYFNRSHQSSYIGTTYLMSVCCFTPLYGRLADILGRRGAMLLALSLFGSGTFLCGIAPSMNVLIAARVIAGMGGGGSVPQFYVSFCWLQLSSIES